MLRRSSLLFLVFIIHSKSLLQKLPSVIIYACPVFFFPLFVIVWLRCTRAKIN